MGTGCPGGRRLRAMGFMGTCGERLAVQADGVCAPLGSWAPAVRGLAVQAGGLRLRSGQAFGVESAEDFDKCSELAPAARE
jgi:hypothetical protein